MVLDGSVQTVVVSISSDGWIKVWKLADLLGPICEGGDQPMASDDVVDLAVEPLASYNADVRLTCVAASTGIF
ncbi:hypothetical protein IWW50_004018 [Coemansia erecta]|nr:hypothetical protein IWW50_004018 [Coemansia erecta]